ncbi:hypothetical protein AA0488_0165 [Kozakia baliensis NRIC 0488]|nr:hypothetical protein AA0488_0165 [Kozakia baliensis NRIC 0488]
MVLRIGGPGDSGAGQHQIQARLSGTTHPGFHPFPVGHILKMRENLCATLAARIGDSGEAFFVSAAKMQNDARFRQSQSKAAPDAGRSPCHEDVRSKHGRKLHSHDAEANQPGFVLAFSKLRQRGMGAAERIAMNFY